LFGRERESRELGVIEYAWDVSMHGTSLCVSLFLQGSKGASRGFPGLGDLIHEDLKYTYA